MAERLKYSYIIFLIKFTEQY